MEPLAFGVRYPDGTPLFADVDVDDLVERLAGVAADAKRVAVSPWTFDEQAPRPQARLDVPSEAGWSYVVAETDPDHDAIMAALEPLARHRKMAAPEQPLHFPEGADRGNWISHEYGGLGDARPRYLLLAGDPTQLPFPLQVDLAAAGALVGRVAFSGADRLDHYRTYAEKVIRLEKADKARPSASATVVATDGGPFDATTYSSKYLAPPVTKRLRDAGVKVNELLGEAASSKGFAEALTDGNPALVFTATHGAGVTAGTQDRDGVAIDPQAVNGAWACAPTGAGRPATDWDWLTAAGLPVGAVVPGGVVVQFACFGYGTTDHSSFSEWLGNRSVVEAREPFVAAIPQRLLANPDGPIAYVGHVDIALAYGFVDPGAPGDVGVAHPRVQPFLTLVAKAVGDLTPIGFAVRDLHEHAASLASEIASTFDVLAQRNILASDLAPPEKANLIDKVIRRNDAMHFLVLGDPAARVRIDNG